MKAKLTTKLPAEASLAEIYQSMKLKLALCRKTDENEFERITPFVLCRDFLVDVYSYSIAKKHFQIYGMEFNGAKDKPDFTGVYLAAKFPSETALSTFTKNLPKLLEVEEKNGLTPTQVLEVSKLERILVGDKKWLQNCLSFSLYTMLLRVVCYQITDAKKLDWLFWFGEQEHSDSKYVKSVPKTTWEKILGDLTLIHTDEFCGFNPSTDSVSVIHHNSGFISVFGSHSEINPASVKKNKHWKIMTEKGLKSHTK